MATTMSYDLTYDAPLAEVVAMLLDPAFRERVCDAQRASRKTVTVTPEGSGTQVLIDQVQPSQGMPGFAKKFVGDEINLVQTEHWSVPASGPATGAGGATIEVAIPGKPGQMSGTVRLSEAGGTTTETVQMEVRVSIPLVGGKIESLVADLLKKALRSEHAVGRDYLAGR